MSDGNLIWLATFASIILATAALSYVVFSRFGNDPKYFVKVLVGSIGAIFPAAWIGFATEAVSDASIFDRVLVTLVVMFFWGGMLGHVLADVLFAMLRRMYRSETAEQE